MESTYHSDATLLVTSGYDGGTLATIFATMVTKDRWVHIISIFILFGSQVAHDEQRMSEKRIFWFLWKKLKVKIPVQLSQQLRCHWKKIRLGTRFDDYLSFCINFSFIQKVEKLAISSKKIQNNWVKCHNAMILPTGKPNHKKIFCDMHVRVFVYPHNPMKTKMT